jgi:predicted nucleic acid-binding protein
VPASGSILYLDSSAIVKLVVQESESDQLRLFLASDLHRFSCALARVEVIRAVRRHGQPAVVRARQALRRLHLLALDDDLLDAAARIDPLVLRALDAVHLAAAGTLGSALQAVVTYDLRMKSSAEALGLPVVSPGASP